MDKDEILKWLEQKGTRRNIEGMARYGIHSDCAFGVSIGTMRPLAERLGGRRILAADGRVGDRGRNPRDRSASAAGSVLAQ
jgi:hypothetical protein